MAIGVAKWVGTANPNLAIVCDLPDSHFAILPDFHGVQGCRRAEHSFDQHSHHPYLIGSWT
jgi:hypothetical protein